MLKQTGSIIGDLKRNCTKTENEFIAEVRGVGEETGRIRSRCRRRLLGTRRGALAALSRVATILAVILVPLVLVLVVLLPLLSILEETRKRKRL